MRIKFKMHESDFKNLLHKLTTSITRTRAVGKWTALQYSMIVNTGDIMGTLCMKPPRIQITLGYTLVFGIYNFDKNPYIPQ